MPRSHPRRLFRNQHMVVHGYNAPCVCTPCGAYAVRPESNRLMLPASPDRHCPAGGLCSLLVAAATYSSGPLLVQQRRQPVRLLNPSVEFPILLREIIRLALSRGNAHSADEFDFAARQPALRRRGRGRQFTMCVVAGSSRTSRSASASASVPSPNREAAFVRLMR